MKESYDFSGAKRGRVIKPKGKTRITIFIDDEVLSAFRARAAETGKGYQTLINDALRAQTLDETPLTLKALRQIIREELKAA